MSPVVTIGLSTSAFMFRGESAQLIDKDEINKEKTIDVTFFVFDRWCCALESC